MSSTTRRDYCDGRLIKVTEWLDAPQGSTLTYVEGKHTWELDGTEISEQQADALINGWGAHVRPRIGAFEHNDGHTTLLVFAATDTHNVFTPVEWAGPTISLADGKLHVDVIGADQSVILPIQPAEGD